MSTEACRKTSSTSVTGAAPFPATPRRCPVGLQIALASVPVPPNSYRTARRAKWEQIVSTFSYSSAAERQHCTVAATQNKQRYFSQCAARLGLESAASCLRVQSTVLHLAVTDLQVRGAPRNCDMQSRGPPLINEVAQNRVLFTSIHTGGCPIRSSPAAEPSKGRVVEQPNPRLGHGSAMLGR